MSDDEKRELDRICREEMVVILKTTKGDGPLLINKDFVERESWIKSMLMKAVRFFKTIFQFK